jgi:hypothetical protein
LQSPINSSTTLEESFLIRLEEKNWTMIFLSLVGENKMELNIGSSETLGEVIGVKEETSD